MKVPGLTTLAVVAALAVGVYVTVIAPPSTPSASKSLASTQACVSTHPQLLVNRDLTSRFADGLGTTHLIGLDFLAAQVVVLFFDSDAVAKRAESAISTTLLGGKRTPAEVAKLKVQLAQQLERHGGAIMFWAKRAPTEPERREVGECIYAVREPTWKSLAFLHGADKTRPFLPR